MRAVEKPLSCYYYSSTRTTVRRMRPGAGRKAFPFSICRQRFLGHTHALVIPTYTHKHCARVRESVHVDEPHARAYYNLFYALAPVPRTVFSFVSPPVRPTRVYNILYSLNMYRTGGGGVERGTGRIVYLNKI
jgi:hypothetical protein